MEQAQDDLYREAGEHFAPAIARLARAMERDADKARDLEQDIHCELWRSFARFDRRCSLKTWIYRVAHNVAADHVAAAANRPRPVPLEEIEALPAAADAERLAAESHAIARVRELIRRLSPLDAQAIVLWLEGQSGAEIAEITGLGVNAANVRIHRVKALLANAFAEPAKGGATS
ncbi:RNA polymerase sigma factor [Pelagerythrobacter sp.]|uniref:RNA polymerase sigma factor n=1 Tax=Pelagerythrobacter sp. TaxID=2800702 RepID=UPI0035B12D44